MKHLYTTMLRTLAVCLTVMLSTLAVSAQQKAVSLAGTRVTNSGGYYEYVPPSYASSKEEFPLLIFIHGIGELGNGTTQLPAILRNGVPKLIENGTFPTSFKVKGKTFSFIVASPQFKNIPSPADVLSLINHLKGKFRIDDKRIYVTGLSMGGGVTEDFASANDSYAKIPAAVVAIAGNMNPKQIGTGPSVIARNGVPVWFLHNNDDPTVPSQYSKDWYSMIEASKPKVNAQPKLTIFNANGHDAWSKAYDPNYKENGMNVYEWMLQYEQGVTATPPPTTPPATPPANKKVNAKPNIGNGMYYPNAMSSFNLNPGDTLCIPAGNYEFIQLGGLVGTAVKPIVITNCGGVVKTGINTLKTDISFSIMGGKFLHISGSGTPGVEYGFDINGKNMLGIKMQGVYLGAGSSDIDIHNFYIHDVGSFIVAKTTQECNNPEFWEGKFVMKNVKIHHIKGRYSDYEGFYIGNTHYIMDYLLCKGIKSHHIQDLEVYNNDLQYMGQDGIQVAMADLGDNKIHHNIVRNYGTAKLDAHGYGMLMGGGSRVKLYNNVVNTGYMPGIALFGSGISYCYNNIISNVENGEGIQVADKLIFEPVTAYIYNNTIYNTGNTGIKVYAYLTTIGHKVFNNLVIEKSLGGSYPTDGIYIRGAQNIKFEHGNNLFSTTANAANVVTDINGGDLHLSSNSTAIDAGKSMTDMGLSIDFDDNKRPVNSGFDIGAYEYQGTKAPNTGNKAPVANAGKDITITLPTNTATLDASASTDPDGKISKFAWKKLSGPTGGTITNAATATTSVTGLTAGTYIFAVTVTDDKAATDTDSVTVKVNPAPANKPPVANAGNAVTITLPMSTITLDGSASKDADGKISKYQWKKVSGPNGSSFSSATSAKTTVSGLVEGIYIFSLTVTDDKDATATANVTVTVKPAVIANKPPVADAGVTITITLPTNTVTLDGSGSKDADGKITKYAWKQIAGPTTVKITNPGQAKTTVTGFTGGTYTFSLTVTDDDNATAAANVVVRVNLKPMVAPVANAGADQTITLPTNTVTLNGSASRDADGQIVKYAWRKLSGPSAGTIAQPDVAVTKVSGLTEGTYLFTLTVTDDDNITHTDTVKVVVKPAPPVNKAPIAVAGNNTTIVLPVNSVILNGSASTDPDGIITSYKWLKISGRDVHFSNADGMINVVSALREGIYVFELVVTDNDKATARDRITVTVLPNKNDNGGNTNSKPVARTQGDLTLKLPTESMNADGSASYSTNSSIVSYVWRQVYGPIQARISAPNEMKTKISGMSFPGSYVFELTVTDANRLSARSTFEVNVLDAGGDPFITELTTYPNPAVSTLYFKQRMKNATQGTITIYNISGKAMKNYVLPAGDNIQQTLDISSLPAGTYLLQVVYKNSTYKWSTKFIKAN